MSNTLQALLPKAADLLALEPEELAGITLEHLNALPLHERRSISPDNFVNPLASPVNHYPEQQRESIGRALMEAWSWLEREGLLAHKPASTGFYFITRRGERLKTAIDVNAYRRANILPKDSLHPDIAIKVWGTFLRGDYDTAVFQAFKEVEVAVRTVGGYTNADFGPELMRKAFGTTGKLTDTSLLKGEQEAMSHLFAGASGLFRNPTAHRYAISDAIEAAELIMFASRLRKIVDARNS